MSQYKGVIQFSAESWGVVKCAEEAQGTVELSCDRMILEYTQDQYCDIYGNSHFIILVNVNHTLMTFDDCSRVTVRQEMWHEGLLGEQVPHGLWCHQPINMTKSCSCRKRAVRKVTPYCMRIRNLPAVSGEVLQCEPFPSICCRTVLLYNYEVLSHLTETSTEHFRTKFVKYFVFIF